MNKDPYCRARLTYWADAPVEVDVEVFDGRVHRESLRWQESGFELMAHRSEVRNWRDTETLEAFHYDEMTELARRLTGCRAVLFYPTLLRAPDLARRHADFGPVRLVHSDYTEAYRAMIADPDHPYHAILRPSMQRAGITAREIAEAERVLTLQVWRNIGASRPDWPMCFCDARTVTRGELVPITVDEYGGLRTEFQSFAVRPQRAADHRWYTYPLMAPDEVVVFRAYDSACVERGEPFWTPHTAFRDPVAGPRAPGRESIEMRAVCLF